jgi:GTP-binding protein Era
MSAQAFKAGNVALIGKPNVGKSTLLNHIVGHKVSIVSNKPQTTRRRVTGIATTDRYQIAFIDTPGIHEPHNRLGRSMVEQARGVLTGVEVIVYVADGSHHPGEMDREIAKQIKGSAEDQKIPVLLCMNKMDILKAEDVQRNVDAYMKLLGAEEYMLTTATQGHNVDNLVELIVSKLPERAPMYDDDEYTDQSSRFLTAELVREKILRTTREEVPHAVAVMVDEWEDEPNFTRISATILVEKSSQRGILIGKQGTFLKEIGSSARQEIEAFLGHKIYLELHVKVSEGWRQNPRVLHELEYFE